MGLKDDIESVRATGERLRLTRQKLKQLDYERRRLEARFLKRSEPAPDRRGRLADVNPAP